MIFLKDERDGQDVTDDKEHQDEHSPTEVIYELSPDHNESLLSVADSRTPSQQPSPSKSEDVVSEESDTNDEVEKKQETAEESDENEEEEEEKEKDEDSDESSESSDSEDDSHEEEEDNSIEETAIASKQSKKSKEKDGKLSMASEDDSESDEGTKEPAGILPDTMVIDDDSTEPLVEKRRKEGDSNKEESKTSKENAEKIDKANETVDGSSPFEKSADYSKKSVEDLEYLQEDIHKELAQITGKTQKRKHKKTSSSNQRERKHKDKSSSKHKEKEKERDKEKEREKEKERDKEKEKQWGSEPRGHSRKDYEKERKYYETEDPSWPHDSRRRRTQKDERRDWNEKGTWTQTRPDRPPNRTETRNKNPQREAKETQSLKEETVSKEGEVVGGLNGSKDGAQKRVISDSMRVMIKESMIERKGFSHEIVDEDSDESGEHLLIDANTSDVSAAASSSDEEPDVASSPEVPKLPPYLPAIRGCRNVEEFQWLNRIEEGTYGVVYRAKDKRSGEVVALKKLKMEKEKEGFPITSLREINTLLKSQHPNIVTVQEIVVGSNMDKIYIVMDFVEHDLKALMETMTQAFLGGEIKTIMIQLLRAVNHLHDNWILHRDIKTSNLLLSNKGILKVGDFGLAREYGSPLKAYTPIVVTLWYRAPELLLGAKEYSTPIDLWSVGCVFAELLTMKPLFNGQSEISQINKIFKELGTPSDKIWPGPPAYSEFPATRKMTFAEYPYNNLRNRFGATLTDNGFDLLNSFLTYDPKRRITAEAALKHEYFKESPSPVDPSMFPSWPARSEGAKRAKKASPKAPEGGNFYKTLSGDGDGAFHIPAGKSQGSSAVPGFTLKF